MHELLRALDACSDGRAKTHLQEARIDAREYLLTQQSEQDHHGGGAHSEIAHEDGAPSGQRASRPSGVALADALDTLLTHPLGSASPRLKPGLHNWDESAREEERGHHGEAHRERERHEHGACDPGQEERGRKDGEDREHDEKPRDDDFAARRKDGARDGLPIAEMPVDILDSDDRLVDEDADREREPAERHEVDGLTGSPKCDECGEKGERDGGHVDEGASKAPESEENNPAGEKRAQQAFETQRVQRVGNVERLVELEGDVDVFRNGRPERGKRTANAPYDVERRGVGALGDGDVDGATAVDERVARQDVRSVFRVAVSRR